MSNQFHSNDYGTFQIDTYSKKFHRLDYVTFNEDDFQAMKTTVNYKKEVNEWLSSPDLLPVTPINCISPEHFYMLFLYKKRLQALGLEYKYSSKCKNDNNVNYATIYRNKNKAHRLSSVVIDKDEEIFLAKDNSVFAQITEGDANVYAVTHVDSAHAAKRPCSFKDNSHPLKNSNIFVVQKDKEHALCYPYELRKNQLITKAILSVIPLNFIIFLLDCALIMQAWWLALILLIILIILVFPSIEFCKIVISGFKSILAFEKLTTDDHGFSPEEFCFSIGNKVKTLLYAQKVEEITCIIDLDVAELLSSHQNIIHCSLGNIDILSFSKDTLNQKIRIRQGVNIWRTENETLKKESIVLELELKRKNNRLDQTIPACPYCVDAYPWSKESGFTSCNKNTAYMKGEWAISDWKETPLSANPKLGWLFEKEYKSGKFYWINQYLSEGGKK